MQSDYNIGDRVVRRKPTGEVGERNFIYTVSRIEESRSGNKGSNALYFKTSVLNKGGETMIFECGVKPYNDVPAGRQRGYIPFGRK